LAILLRLIEQDLTSHQTHYIVENKNKLDGIKLFSEKGVDWWKECLRQHAYKQTLIEFIECWDVWKKIRDQVNEIETVSLELIYRSFLPGWQSSCC